MTSPVVPAPVPDVAAQVVDTAGLDTLIAVLRGDGWVVLGPTVSDGVVRPGMLTGVDDLPRGVGDTQEPGRYRLRERDDALLFGFAAPAASLKPTLLPSRTLLWRGARTTDGISADTPVDDPAPTALLGVRSCDLAAVAALDRVLGGEWHDRPADPHYAARRREMFVIAVVCGTPASTCFCATTDTGPAPRDGYDLALTEVLDPDGHRFVVDVGSDRGLDVLGRVPSRPAQLSDLEAARTVATRAADSMGRRFAADDMPALLDAEVEHPVWDDVAEQCLACGNCTAVCPTCFCTAVEDVNDLHNEHAERWRVWDSCFTPGFSYVHGGPVRSSTASRYRQWMSHKLGTWRAQFDTSGCVGCGRCITWCPVGIDITALARTLEGSPRSVSAKEALR